MRVLFTSLALLAACGGHTTNGNDSGDSGDATRPDACVGLECQVKACSGAGQTPTTLTGVVYAPNGTLPLFGADVYIPRDAPGPLAEGAECSRCQDLPGFPIAQTKTNEKGEFTLQNVPAGASVPVVISLGKWRRQITVSNVAECAPTALTAEQTRLPKTKAEGDIPKIAITTGNADSLECLIRKLGIDDTEITNDQGTGRVNLYKGNGVGQFKAGYPGGSGQSLAAAKPFWSSVDKLKAYDIVIFSCEGQQNPGTKPQEALDAVKAYADFGGRVFLSHWHNIWVEGSTQGGGNQKPAVWPEIATWTNSPTTFGGSGDHDVIDQTANPKGAQFAAWMTNVMGSTTPGEIPIQSQTGKQTCEAVNPIKAERWTYWKDNNTDYTQNFQFTTPNEAAADARCGKVVFSDMHVSGGPQAGDYPDSCGGSLALSPQEKALAFMFFDIATCISIIP